MTGTRSWKGKAKLGSSTASFLSTLQAGTGLPVILDTSLSKRCIGHTAQVCACGSCELTLGPTLLSEKQSGGPLLSPSNWAATPQKVRLRPFCPSMMMQSRKRVSTGFLLPAASTSVKRPPWMETCGGCADPRPAATSVATACERRFFRWAGSVIRISSR